MSTIACGRDVDEGGVPTMPRSSGRGRHSKVVCEGVVVVQFGGWCCQSRRRLSSKYVVPSLYLERFRNGRRNEGYHLFKSAPGKDEIGNYVLLLSRLVCSRRVQGL